MKYYLLVILFFAATVYVTAQEKIHWLTLKEATERNKQQPKKFLIDVYTEWCGWCKRMDATTFEDKAVVSYVNKNFYAVKLDAETKDTFIIRISRMSFYLNTKQMKLH